MANPTLLTMPMCVNADKNTIPPTDAGTSGLFSEEYGWQDINSLPLASGGKAPNRRDFNGVFALLGGIAYACQRGYTFEWDATQDYEVGCIVIDSTDGKRYECIADVRANVTPPSSDTTHWKEFGTDISNFANTDLSNLSTAGENKIKNVTTNRANIDLSNLTATGLNAFATKTLSNLDINNLTYHLVVESYYNSSTGGWYRVYDDGWVEQGGCIAGTNGHTYFSTTITLLKPMSDTKYYVGMTNYDNTTAYTSGYYNASTTKFDAVNIVSYESNMAKWFVAGMGASV